MSFTFKFLSAHRRVVMSCGCPVPTADCSAARPRPCLRSHSRQAFMRKTATIRRQRRAPAPRPDLMSAGHFFMETISKTKCDCRAVFTFFCRHPFSPLIQAHGRERQGEMVKMPPRRISVGLGWWGGREPSTLQKQRLTGHWSLRPAQVINQGR